MKSKAVLFIVCTILFSLVASVPAFSAVKVYPRVQLAVLLDTSNSMDGLIAQAKTQLWKIVNELARARQDGEHIRLEVGLYEYGKSSIPAGEGHIRMISPLTDDLDLISDELFKLKTNGGEEYCGKVIKSAASGLDWSTNDNDLKIIVIAGNEPFTQGNTDYRSACKSAITKGIVINTIFCGNYDKGIATKWKHGADLADGKYMNIDQNRSIVHIDAPQDKEITRLGEELNTTYIVYGTGGMRGKMRQEKQDLNSKSVGSSVMAQRSVAKASKQYRNTGWDLVDAEAEGKVRAEELEEAQLPEEMKKMTKEQRRKYVEDKKSKRGKIQKRILELNEARRKYVAEKIAKSGDDNTLDAAMLRAIREQAEKKNFSFK